MTAALPMPPYEWLAPSWAEFCTTLEAGRLPHALLISGIAGIGAEAFALAAAQLLLCQNPDKQVSCGVCRACQLVRAESHPDWELIAPEAEGKAIRVDQIRELSDRVGQTAQQGGRKVLVISPADAMNINAANALLKNLEEPTADTVFLLVSSAAHKVLPTIRSRCSKLQLSAPSSEAGVRWLEGLGVREAAQCLDESYGAPLLAKQRQDSGWYEDRQQFYSSLADILSKSVAPTAVAQKYARSDVSKILVWLRRAVESALLARHSDTAVSDDLQALHEALGGRDERALFAFIDVLQQVERWEASSANLNPALSIEQLLIQWHDILGTGVSTSSGPQGPDVLARIDL